MCAQLLGLKDAQEATRDRWCQPGGACTIEMAAGFRVCLSQGPTVAGHQTATTELEVEPKAVGPVERWILALRARETKDASGMGDETREHFPDMMVVED